MEGAGERGGQGGGEVVCRGLHRQRGVRESQSEYQCKGFFYIYIFL